MKILLLFGAGMVAGLMNVIAGGGTIVTFPALIFAGIPSIAANATSTMALLPGTLAGVFGFRKNLAAVRSWIWIFLPASALGGLVGAILLTRTPQPLFDQLVPFLVLFATIVFTAHEIFARLFRVEAMKRNSLRWLASAMFFQFAIAIYGGYFGAAIGILMLASLGVLGFSHIHEMNVVKNILGFLINAVAAVYFAAHGLVQWPSAGMVALGSVVGGYAGANFAQRVEQKTVRRLITLIGLGISALLFHKSLRLT